MTALVQLALALLIAAQQPHVPAELRAQAVQVATLAISISETYTPVGAAPIAVETPENTAGGGVDEALAEIAAERAALIAERDALHRKAEEMGGSRDWIAAYKGVLTRDIKSKMEALNERERLLREEYGF